MDSITDIFSGIWRSFSRGLCSEAYSEPCQTSIMERFCFCLIVNGRKALSIFVRHPIASYFNNENATTTSTDFTVDLDQI